MEEQKDRKCQETAVCSMLSQETMGCSTPYCDLALGGVVSAVRLWVG